MTKKIQMLKKLVHILLLKQLSTPKKRGYKKRATGYTNRDIKVVLDNVKFIFPIIDNK
jgi:hypothetical protein